MAKSEGMRNITQAKLASGSETVQVKKEGIKQFEGLADQAMAKVQGGLDRAAAAETQARQESLTAADRGLELDKETGKYKPTDVRAAREKAQTQALEARSQMAAGEAEREEKKLSLAQSREKRLGQQQEREFATEKAKIDIAQARLDLDYQKALSNDRQESLDARRSIIDKQTARIDKLDSAMLGIGTKEGAASLMQQLGSDLVNVAGADPRMANVLAAMRTGGGLNPEQANRLRTFIQSKKDNIILQTMEGSGVILDSADMTSPLMQEYNAYAANYKPVFESAMQMELQIASQLDEAARKEYEKGTRWLSKTHTERKRHFRKATAQMFNYERSQRGNVGSDSQFFRGPGGQPPGAEQLRGTPRPTEQR